MPLYDPPPHPAYVHSYPDTDPAVTQAYADKTAFYSGMQVVVETYEDFRDRVTGLPPVSDGTVQIPATQGDTPDVASES